MGNGQYNVQLLRNDNLSVLVTYTVMASDTDRIRFVLVNSNATQPTRVYIRGLAPLQSIGSLDSVTKFGSGSVALVELRVAGDLGADLGPAGDAVVVDQVGIIDVGGNVLDGISVSGNRLDTLIVNGDLKGSITLGNGTIGSVDVEGNITGPSGDPVNIWARNGIERITAASINANIDAAYAGGAGNLGFMSITTGGFVGSLRAQNVLNPNVGEGILMAGDLDADIEIVNDVLEPIQIDGELRSGRTLNVLGRLLDDGTNNGLISLPAGGLKGQIIINGGNDSGEWQGPVSVGGVSLLPRPTYAQLSGTLGGGAVGKAPFALHDEDCLPPNGSGLLVIQDLVSGSAAITLRHYGPISNDTAASPVVVKWNCGSSWVDATMLFSVTESPNGNRRELRVGAAPGMTDASFMAGEYCIRPVLDLSNPDRLRCDDVVGRPVVADYDYRFSLFHDCNGNQIADPEDIEAGIAADCNNNDRPDSCDIASGISEDINGDGVPDECDNPPPPCTTDWDQSGTVNSGDISAFLTAWIQSVNDATLDADFNGDLAVNSGDISAFLTAWIADVANGC